MSICPEQVCFIIWKVVSVYPITGVKNEEPEQHCSLFLFLSRISLLLKLKVLLMQISGSCWSNCWSIRLCCPEEDQAWSWEGYIHFCEEHSTTNCRYDVCHIWWKPWWRWFPLYDLQWWKHIWDSLRHVVKGYPCEYGLQKNIKLV